MLPEPKSIGGILSKLRQSTLSSQTNISRLQSPFHQPFQKFRCLVAELFSCVNISQRVTCVIVVCHHPHAPIWDQILGEPSSPCTFRVGVKAMYGDNAVRVPESAKPNDKICRNNLLEKYFRHDVWILFTLLLVSCRGWQP